MKKLNKKGELTTKEIMEIVLGGAATLLLIFLLYSLIAPNFEKDDETAKSYFDSFEDAVAVADSGETGTFSMWMPVVEGGKKYSLIYFGESLSFGSGGRQYTSFGENINHVCICYLEEPYTCEYCRNLNYPVVMSVLGDSKWAVATGQEIKITKGDSVYNVEKIEKV